MKKIPRRGRAISNCQNIHHIPWYIYRVKTRSLLWEFWNVKKILILSETNPRCLIDGVFSWKSRREYSIFPYLEMRILNVRCTEGWKSRNVRMMFSSSGENFSRFLTAGVYIPLSPKHRRQNLVSLKPSKPSFPTLYLLKAFKCITKHSERLTFDHIPVCCQSKAGFFC